MKQAASQHKKSPFDFDLPDFDLGALLETFDITAFDFGSVGIPAMPGAVAAPTAPNSPSAAASGAPSATSGQPAPQADQTAAKTGSKGTKALTTAQQEIGVKEQPKGSNRGPRVDQYQGGKGQYWCCHFVSWCFEQNGASPFGHKGWVEGLRRWAKSHNVYTPSGQAAPQAGDVFTMARHDKTGKLVGGHTGFVESYNVKARSVRTVEGNSSDSVRQRTRPVSSLDGFIRL